MRVPLSWIREFAPVPTDPATVADALNEIGLIVDAVETPGEGMSGVVVAEVVEVVDHPDADKLTLVDVDFGDGQARVVCGARNLSSGDRVPYAPPGAVLPGGFELERRKIRGQMSEGMVCSARELGVGDDHEGILHLPLTSGLGADVRDVLGLGEVVFELDITPNRPDAMSIVGVARDVAAKLDLPLDVPAPKAGGDGPASTTSCTVDILDPQRCPRYVAMTGSVTVGSSPDWLARRLTLAGLRPISNVVDVTNYVLLERGQPLHAFDHDRLGGAGIRVRVAKAGETLTTLDGVERVLTSEDLLICDADDRPQALAGIMGGAGSEVDEATGRVLLESAYFSSAGVLRTSKRLGLRTESSARFERGTDPNGVDVAARRAWELLEEVASGRAGSDAVDVYPEPVQRERITLRPARLNAVLGCDLTETEIRRHLEALEMEVEGEEERLIVTVPTFRPDLEREIDLVEEVARLHGYNQIERTLPKGSHHVGRLTREQRDRRLVRDTLVGMGLCEAMNLALISPDDLERSGHPVLGIEVENPLRADESLLRPSVLPRLLRSVAFNAAHGIPDVSLFEVGTVFHPANDGAVLPDEREHLAVALAGTIRRRPHEPDRVVDVHDVVGILEAVVDALEVSDWLLEPAVRPGFHPRRCAAVFIDGVEAGALGELAAEVISAFELPDPTVGVELDVDRLVASKRRERWYSEPSRYPPSSIDLAFVLPQEEPAGRVRATLHAAAGDLAEEIIPFDVFLGEGLAPGHVSVAFRLRFRAADRTLDEREIAELRVKCVEAVERTHRGELRA